MEKVVKVTIRDAEIEDAKAIRQVSKEAWMDTFPNTEFGITKDDLIARFTYSSLEAENIHTKERQKIIKEDENQRYWVAEVDKKIVGFCLAKKGDKRNILQAIHIVPEYQGKGLGAKLMKVSLDWLGNEKEIQLSVAVYNQRAISFYERFGFKKTGKKLKSDITNLPSGKEIPQIEMLKAY